MTTTEALKELAASLETSSNASTNVGVLNDIAAALGYEGSPAKTNPEAVLHIASVASVGGGVE